MVIMSEPEPTSREARREAHHQSILDAAERLFSAERYGLVTVSDIAEAARLSVGGVYLCFRSKVDVAVATALRSLEREEDMALWALRHRGLARLLLVAGGDGGGEDLSERTARDLARAMASRESTWAGVLGALAQDALADLAARPE